MANIDTLANVKVLLGKATLDTSDDARITAFLPICTSDIKEYCNNTFVDSAGVETYPDALKSTFARFIAWRLSSYGFAQTMEQAMYPPDILADLNKFKYVRLAFSAKRIKYNDRRGRDPIRVVP